MDKVNPGSVLLSGVLMFEHLGWTDAATTSFERWSDDRRQDVTYDFARLMEGATEVKCSEFGAAIVDRLYQTWRNNDHRPRHVTGAAGQIGYSLLFRIASGQMLGPDTPIVLHLLEIEPAMKSLEGVVMERTTAPFRCSPTSKRPVDLNNAFAHHWALLVGSFRASRYGAGDLLKVNGGIFKPQGEAISATRRVTCDPRRCNPCTRTV